MRVRAFGLLLKNTARIIGRSGDLGQGSCGGGASQQRLLCWGAAAPVVKKLSFLQRGAWELSCGGSNHCISLSCEVPASQPCAGGHLVGPALPDGCVGQARRRACLPPPCALGEDPRRTLMWNCACLLQPLRQPVRAMHPAGQNSSVCFVTAEFIRYGCIACPLRATLLAVLIIFHCISPLSERLIIALIVVQLGVLRRLCDSPKETEQGRT